MPEVIHKGKRAMQSEHLRREIKRLHKLGWCDVPIANEIGVCDGTVSRIRKEMGLKSNYKENRGGYESWTERGVIIAKINGSKKTVFEQCEDILGDRVHFNAFPDTHTLDGRITLLGIIIDTANRIAPMLGKPRIGKKPADLFKPRLIEGRV